jgi:hypothetical protein
VFAARPTAYSRVAAMQGYWIYETSDIRYTSEKTIDNLLIEEVNFAVGFLKSPISMICILNSYPNRR